MIPAQFDYVAPTTVEEAVQVLAEAGDDAKVLAGGQSLLPVMRMRLNAPELVVDLGRVASLSSESGPEPSPPVAPPPSAGPAPGASGAVPRAAGAAV